MKIQRNNRTGARFITLPQAICDAKGWFRGDELTLDETMFPGVVVLRKTGNSKR